MKVVILAVTLVLGTCGSRKENQNTRPYNVVPASTAYEFVELKIPATFAYDSILVYDSLSQATYHVYFIQSELPQMRIFKHKITEMFMERIRWEQSYVEHCKGDALDGCGYTFTVRPIAFYSTDDIISITHIVDTYGARGNHHAYSWLTFNFDLRSNERIHFRDVFNLPYQTDSIAFAALVRETDTMEYCMDWDVPFDSVDFSFAADGMYLNPETSWACAQNRSFLPIDSLHKYLKPRWQKVEY